MSQSQNTPQEIVYTDILLWHDWWNTIPQITTLAAGGNYKFTITPETNGQWCMSTIKRAWTTTVESKLVLEWEPVEFTINDAVPGTYAFVCNGMWMEQGKVIIEA